MPSRKPTIIPPPLPRKRKPDAQPDPDPESDADHGHRQQHRKPPASKARKASHPQPHPRPNAKTTSHNTSNETPIEDSVRVQVPASSAPHPPPKKRKTVTDVFEFTASDSEEEVEVVESGGEGGGARRGGRRAQGQGQGQGKAKGKQAASAGRKGRKNATTTTTATRTKPAPVGRQETQDKIVVDMSGVVGRTLEAEDEEEEEEEEDVSRRKSVARKGLQSGKRKGKESRGRDRDGEREEEEDDGYGDQSIGVDIDKINLALHMPRPTDKLPRVPPRTSLVGGGSKKEVPPVAPASVEDDIVDEGEEVDGDEDEGEEEVDGDEEGEGQNGGETVPAEEVDEEVVEEEEDEEEADPTFYPSSNPNPDHSLNEATVDRIIMAPTPQRPQGAPQTTTTPIPPRKRKPPRLVRDFHALLALYDTHLTALEAAAATLDEEYYQLRTLYPQILKARKTLVAGAREEESPRKRAAMEVCAREVPGVRGALERVMYTATVVGDGMVSYRRVVKELNGLLEGRGWEGKEGKERRVSLGGGAGRSGNGESTPGMEARRQDRRRERLRERERWEAQQAEEEREEERRESDMVIVIENGSERDQEEEEEEEIEEEEAEEEMPRAAGNRGVREPRAGRGARDVVIHDDVSPEPEPEPEQDQQDPEADGFEYEVYDPPTPPPHHHHHHNHKHNHHPKIITLGSDAPTERVTSLLGERRPTNNHKGKGKALPTSTPPPPSDWTDPEIRALLMGIHHHWPAHAEDLPSAIKRSDEDGYLSESPTPPQGGLQRRGEAEIAEKVLEVARDFVAVGGGGRGGMWVEILRAAEGWRVGRGEGERGVEVYEDGDREGEGDVQSQQQQVVVVLPEDEDEADSEYYELEDDEVEG